jgi:hypothetical protein
LAVGALGVVYGCRYTSDHTTMDDMFRLRRRRSRGSTRPPRVLLTRTLTGGVRRHGQ